MSLFWTFKKRGGIKKSGLNKSVIYVVIYCIILYMYEVRSGCVYKHIILLTSRDNDSESDNDNNYFR